MNQNKMKYHRYRFGLIGNFKVLLCRIFGHRLNNNPGFHWCGRCGLAYEECYYPEDYWVDSGIVKVPEDEIADYLLERIKIKLKL